MEKTDIKKAVVTDNHTPQDGRNKYNKDLNIFKLVDQFCKKNLEFDLFGNDAKLYISLLDTCNKLLWKNPFRQSLKQLSSRSGLSISSVRRTIKRLHQFGLIEVKIGKSGSHIDENNMTLIRLLSDTTMTSDTDTTMTSDELSSVAKSDQSDTIMTSDDDKNNGRSDTMYGVMVTPDQTISPIIYNIKQNSISVYYELIKKFDFFKNEIKIKMRDFLSDVDFISEQEELNPDVDIQLSLKKSVVNYYATEDGHKKILKDIDKNGLPVVWKRYFADGIADHRNQVRKKTVNNRPAKTSERIPMPTNEQYQNDLR